MPVHITSYQIGASETGADTFDFSQLTTEPTAPEAGKHEGARDWIKVESCQLGDSADTDGDYLLTSIKHSATDTSLVDQTDTEASSRLFVGNLTLDSQASLADAGFGGGVTVASGDVNGGDGQHDDLLGCSVRDDWTLDFQPQFTTEPTAPEAGTDKDWIIVESYQTGFVGADQTFNDLAVDPNNPNADLPKGDWIADVTYESVEVLGQPTETIWMTYGHIEY